MVNEEKIMPSTKPGWRTTEGWLTAAVSIVGALLALGVVDPGGAGVINQIIGGAMTVLAALGYDATRSKVKTGG